MSCLSEKGPMSLKTWNQRHSTHPISASSEQSSSAPNVATGTNGSALQWKCFCSLALHSALAWNSTKKL